MRLTAAKDLNNYKVMKAPAETGVFYSFGQYFTKSGNKKRLGNVVNNLEGSTGTGIELHGGHENAEWNPMRSGRP
jgi:hypothetical protein